MQIGRATMVALQTGAVAYGVSVYLREAEAERAVTAAAALDERAFEACERSDYAGAARLVAQAVAQLRRVFPPESSQVAHEMVKLGKLRCRLLTSHINLIHLCLGLVIKAVNHRQIFLMVKIFLTPFCFFRLNLRIELVKHFLSFAKI